MITEAVKYMHLQEDAKAVEKHLHAIVDPKTTEAEKPELRFRAAIRLRRIEREVNLLREAMLKDFKEKETEENE